MSRGISSNMDLKQIETFVRVAEHGSFSRAAVALQIAQPALSRQVGALETELRQRLFDRNGRGVTLTPAGRRLLAHGVGILQQVERARLDLEDHRGAPVGRLALGLPPSISRTVTAPLVEAFRERFPKATLSVVESLSAYMVEWLAQGRIDAAVVYPVLPSASIELEPLLEEPLMLVRAAPPPRSAVRARAGGQTKTGQAVLGPTVVGQAAVGHAPIGRPMGLSDLAGQPLVIPSRPHSIRVLVESTLAAASLKPRIGLEIESVPAMLSLAARGDLQAVLTLNALRELPAGLALVAHPIELPRDVGPDANPQSNPRGSRQPGRAAGRGRSMSIRLWLATSSQRPKGPLLQQAMGLLREQLAAVLVRRG
jgi:LysR family transcriptional regulator, nitrogen assimilation regulatory protein